MGKKMLYIMAMVAVAFMVSGGLRKKENGSERHIHPVAAGQTVWDIAPDYQ